MRKLTTDESLDALRVLKERVGYWKERLQEDLEGWGIIEGWLDDDIDQILSEYRSPLVRDLADAYCEARDFGIRDLEAYTLREPSSFLYWLHSPSGSRLYHITEMSMEEAKVDTYGKQAG